MLTRPEFQALLQRKDTLILDGALATELEVRGYNLNHPLWSGKILKEYPEVIQQIHLDYYLAGADIAITASYQASTQGFLDHFELKETDAKELIKRSVRLAQHARFEAVQSGLLSANIELLIAGSVGPYGAYLSDGSEYRGDYMRSSEEFKGFHRPRIEALVDAGVDILAIETMPSMPEIIAVLEILSTDFPDAVSWISCTLKDPEHLSDGTLIREVKDLVERSNQVVAFGVNCIPIELVTPFIQHMAPSKIPILCYPNSGEIWDAEAKTWHGGNRTIKMFGSQAIEWRAAGASLIGGCCRTGPKDIEDILQSLRVNRS
ncbi:hypothetical protein M433DRAFT_156898 [Acidomyces richmondensis BFW]|nr:MAG: hypothetical protein FE78DRAFT_93938 [Acidomyces sp. 'richmondensis']KYG43325.1 hypothetical protein M433DRAFT_156898 [Acidomyces richmondensis BFW]